MADRRTQVRSMTLAIVHEVTRRSGSTQKYRLFGKDSRSDSCKTNFVGVARPNTRRQEDVSSQPSSISELYVEHFNEHYKESVASMEVSQ